MSKWIDFSLDERKAMIQGVVEARQIDEAAAEKDWWVTAVLYALFHSSVSEYLLFKGGTSLSKGWDIINRFSEDIDLALSRDYFLNVKQLSCASCTSNTQIHNLREKGQDFLYGEFKDELSAKLVEMGLEVTVLTDNDISNENGEPQKVPHDKDPSVIYVQYPSLYDSQAAYAIPTVKVEISVLSMSEPYEMRRISSLIEQTFKDEDVDSDLVQTIRTVSPARRLMSLAAKQHLPDGGATLKMSCSMFFSGDTICVIISLPMPRQICHFSNCQRFIHLGSTTDARKCSISWRLEARRSEKPIHPKTMARRRTEKKVNISTIDRKRLYTISEAARILGVSRSYFYYCFDHDELFPKPTLVNGMTRLNGNDIIEIIALRGRKGL